MFRNHFVSRLFRAFIFLAIPALAAAQNSLFTATLLECDGSCAFSPSRYRSLQC